MRKGIFEIINSYLIKWNPLGVPENVVETEYVDFIPIIFDYVSGKNDALKKIEDYLTDLFGVGFENEKLFNETQALLKNVKKSLIEQNLII